MSNDSVPGFVLLLVAAYFGHHLLAGWRTGTVIIPISFISELEFERTENQRDYWAVMIVNAICIVVTVVAAGFILARAGLARTI